MEKVLTLVRLYYFRVDYIAVILIRDLQGQKARRFEHFCQSQPFRQEVIMDNGVVRFLMDGIHVLPADVMKDQQVAGGS